uniref:Nudix hydrolase 7-like n=1 Tax=Rhizophora mucronata TaxID=61149 RepID=A0A2P2LKV3_RHIMU
MFLHKYRAVKITKCQAESLKEFQSMQRTGKVLEVRSSAGRVEKVFEKSRLP